MPINSFRALGRPSVSLASLLSQYPMSALKPSFGSAPEVERVPSLKKINGVYRRRLKAEEIIQEGDVYGTPGNPPAEVAAGHRAEWSASFKGSGMWRPVVVPAGYRIRDLDEIIQGGDLGAAIDGNKVNVDWANPVKADASNATTFRGDTVRSMLKQTRLPRRVHGLLYYGDDFVVLTKIETDAQKIERLTKELETAKADFAQFRNNSAEIIRGLQAKITSVRNVID